MLSAFCEFLQRYRSKGRSTWEWILLVLTDASLCGRLSLDKEVPMQRVQSCLNLYINHSKSGRELIDLGFERQAYLI